MLHRRKDQEHLQEIFRTGLAAVNGEQAVKQNLYATPSQWLIGDFPIERQTIKAIHVYGAGKAAAAMARAAEEFFLRHSPESFAGGLVVVKQGHTLPLKKVQIREASHPIPDERGVQAGEKMLADLKTLSAQDLVVFLLSGGASALLPAPVAGLTLAEKRRITQGLLDCGANISEINIVRRHCSRIKGGQLAQAAGMAQVVTLAISDVPGNEPAAIGSGPTVADPTTLDDVVAVLRRYKMETPQLIACLKETPKMLQKSFFKIIGTNGLATFAAEESAKNLGFHVNPNAEFLTEEIAAVALKWKTLKAQADRLLPRPYCLVCGGEPTVHVTGTGKGGRNMELALRLASDLSGTFSFLSAGTDGSDGPTDAAGAFCDETTLGRARQLGLNPEKFLRDQDSYHFFEKLGDLLKTGPTQTNVMDLQILIVS